MTVHICQMCVFIFVSFEKKLVHDEMIKFIKQVRTCNHFPPGMVTMK